MSYLHVQIQKIVGRRAPGFEGSKQFFFSNREVLMLSGLVMKRLGCTQTAVVRNNSAVFYVSPGWMNEF